MTARRVSFVDAQAGSPVRVEVRLVNGDADRTRVEARALVNMCGNRDAISLLVEYEEVALG
jgi:hypothetical protein